MEISKKEAAILILKFHMKQTLLYKTIKFFRVMYKKMNGKNLVRYWWTLEEKNGLCERTEIVVTEETECDHCMRKHETGSKMSRLYDIENESVYYLCVRCADDNTGRYEPGYYPW